MDQDCDEGTRVDALTFIASLIDSLAWPSIVLAMVILLRKPIRDLLPLLKRAKYKDLDLVFGKELSELDAKADQACLPPSVEPTALKLESAEEWTFDEYISRLAAVSPRAAIAEAWRYVELALQRAYGRPEVATPSNTLRTARLLHMSGKLPQEAVSLIADLRVLRNRAVHAEDFELSTDEAIHFGRLAERIIASIHVNQLDEKTMGHNGH